VLTCAMLSGRGARSGSGVGARWAVEDRWAADPAAAGTPTGRWHPVRRWPGGGHWDRPCADHWLRLAAPARGVRSIECGRAPPLCGLDRRRARPWRRAPTPLAYFRNDFSTMARSPSLPASTCSTLLKPSVGIPAGRRTSRGALARKPAA